MYEAERIITDDDEEIDHHPLNTANFKCPISPSPSHGLQQDERNKGLATK
jgi:hypothetical protein